MSVPGIDKLTFRLAVSADDGLQDLTVTVGPASIDTGSVTLRPFVTVAGGEAPIGGRRIMVGLAAGDTARFAAKWTLGPAVTFDLVGSNGPIDLVAPTLDDPAQAALRAVEVVADLVAAIAMSTDAVRTCWTSRLREHRARAAEGRAARPRRHRADRRAVRPGHPGRPRRRAVREHRRAPASPSRSTS